MRINNLLNIKQAKSDQQSGAISVGKGPARQLELLPGRLLKATVLDYLPDGKVLLDVDGRQITARSRIPLDKTTLWLEVQQGGETPLLGLAEKKGAVRQFLKFFLSSGNDLTRAVDLLNNFNAAQPDNLPPEFHFLRIFRQVVANGNGAPENILKLLHLLGRPVSPNDQTPSLTEQLARLIDNIDQQTSKSGEDINILKKMGEYLEIIHDLNRRQAPANQEDLFLYPCFFAGESGWGQWMFSADQDRDKAQTKSCQINFFLEMSKVGELHCQLLVAEKNIQGRFFCASEKVVSHFTGLLPELEKILTGMGYRRVTLSSQPLSAPLMGQLQKKLEEKSGRAAVSIVDLKA